MLDISSNQRGLLLLDGMRSKVSRLVNDQVIVFFLEQGVSSNELASNCKLKHSLACIPMAGPPLASLKLVELYLFQPQKMMSCSEAEVVVTADWKI